MIAAVKTTDTNSIEFNVVTHTMIVAEIALVLCSYVKINVITHTLMPKHV